MAAKKAGFDQPAPTPGITAGGEATAPEATGESKSGTETAQGAQIIAAA
jgi:hypothetical protein